MADNTPPDRHIDLSGASRDRDLDAAARRQAAGIGERLRAAFERGCAEHDIAGRLDGPPERMAVVFAGQEGADGPRVLQAFVDELAGVGVCAGKQIVVPATLTDAEAEAAEAAILHAVTRLRILLIELNSYLSGGLAWTLGAADPRLAARGLAVYRFPTTAPVDVTAHDEGVRIAVQAGDLGEVTSSGFYIPTRLRGDFEVSLRYRLPRWEPGPEAASVALFAQDEPSLLRYYTQRRSCAGGAHQLLGNFHNRVFTTPQTIAVMDGAFRLTRRDRVVGAWHRAPGDADWTLLGDHEGDPAADVIIGCKIWSSGSTGGLTAEMSDLQVDATIPTKQLGPVPVRPDPRLSP